MSIIEERFKEGLKQLDTTVSLPENLISIFCSHLDTIAGFELSYPEHQKLKSITKSITNISDRTLRDNFSHIYNQSCIIASSLLEASLKDAFDSYFIDPTDLVQISNDKAASIKFSVSDLVKHYYPSQHDLADDTWYLGALLRNRDNGLNFQNVGSITRSFKEYCRHEIALPPEQLKRITFYLECRNNIAHAGARSDRRFINTIDKEYAARYPLGSDLKLKSEDWAIIKEDYLALVHDVAPVVPTWSPIDLK